MATPRQTGPQPDGAPPERPQDPGDSGAPGPAGGGRDRHPGGVPWRVGTGEGTHGPGSAPAELWLIRAVGPTEADLALLDAAETKRAQAIRRPSDRDVYVAAHATLRRVLGRRLDTDPAALVFLREPCPCCQGPHGRPVLDGDPLHFSLSHSGSHALIAVSGRPVGADIEAVPSPGLVADVAQVLHPAERDRLAALGPDEAATAFARCWARKEAVLKGTGEGLGGEGVTGVLVGAGRRPHPVPGWALHDLPEAPAGYAAAYAVRSAQD